MATRAAHSLDAWLSAARGPSAARLPGQLWDGVSGFQRRLKGLLRPRSATEAVRVIQELRHRAAPFHVVSTGRNWGYGGALPPQQDAVLVCLDGLDQIRLVCTRPVGYAVIEAGVTQGQLAWHLDQEAPEWLLNVTGSSPCTSVLGNTLARGIGYFGARSADLLSVQWLLPDGRLVWSSTPAPGETGFPCMRGPDATSLALQNHGAVALAAAIRLHPRQPVHAMVSVTVKHADSIARVTTRLQAESARMDGVGVAHIGNCARMQGTLVPEMRARLSEDHWPATVRARAAELAYAWANRRLTNPWMGVIPVSGSQAQVQDTFAQLKSRLSPWADLRLLTRNKLLMGQRIAKLLSRHPAFCADMVAANTFLELLGMCSGRPSDFAVRATFGVTGMPVPSGQGLFYFAPCLSPRSAIMREQLAHIDHAYRIEGLEPYVTINVIPRIGAIAITNASYSLSDDIAVERALRCQDNLHQLASRKGWALYRRDINHPAAHEGLSDLGLAWREHEDLPHDMGSAQQQGRNARRA